MADDRIVKSICRLCYNSCGVKVEINCGVPVKIRGDKEHILSSGMLCKKGRTALEVLNHPDRLKIPLKRTGKRGEGRWKEICWDEALEYVAQGLAKVKENYGPLSVVFARGGSKGMADDFLVRFANLFGSPNVSAASYICYSPSFLASKHTYGFFAFPDLEFPPKCVVLWGFDPKASHPPVYRELIQAAEKGASLIVIDVAMNRSVNKPLYWLRLKPGTDLALALGIIHVLLDEKLFDKEFVDHWTIGFDQLQEHVKHYSPERVENITWLARDQIRKTARFISEARPGCILWGNALEATPDSYQTCRAICIIRALTGNLGVPGSDIQCSDIGELRRRSPRFLLTDKLPKSISSQRLGVMAGLLPDFTSATHPLVMKAIIEDDPYPIRGAYIQGGNLVCSNADAAKTAAALKKLDFSVASDMFMTPTTSLADIVLPVASFLEFDSVEQPWHFPAAFVQQKVAQVGEARSDGDILNALARKMGFSENVWDDMEQALDFYLEPAGITFEEFRKKGAIFGHKLYRNYLKEGFLTPSGKVELYSDTLKALGFDPLPDYHEQLPEETGNSAEYPFFLTSRKSKIFYHSGGRQVASLRKVQPDPLAMISHGTAKHHGIKDGDWISISTPKGSICQKASLVDWLDSRVIMAEHGWWFPEKGEDGGFGWDIANLNIIMDGDESVNAEIGSSCLRGVKCRVERCSDQNKFLLPGSCDGQ